ncbi:MAG: PilZ domain-containing protein [Candidatus Omnitrophota bacterium]|jgi:hypothetical protein|nr:MAG: PilZ domain-containing protein [Candidatus Omnitrophota bacterium]
MDKHQGPHNKTERREFSRLDYLKPLAFKVCKPEIIDKLLEGYTSNISQSGILCNIRDNVVSGDIVWLSFDRSTLSICEDIERRCFIYQNGIIGKVVRIEHKEDGSFNVGLKFVTREERNDTNIHPKIYFLQMGLNKNNE